MGGLLTDLRMQTQWERDASQIHFHSNKPQAFVRTSSSRGFESLPLGAHLAAAGNGKCSKSISYNHNHDLPASVLQERFWGTLHVGKTQTNRLFICVITIPSWIKWEASITWPTSASLNPGFLLCFFRFIFILLFPSCASLIVFLFNCNYHFSILSLSQAA